MARIVHDEFLAGKERLVVAGTHGKTTTSSLLAWLFAEGQRAPSFLIGGIPENFGSSFALGRGPRIRHRRRRIRYGILRQGTKVPALLSRRRHPDVCRVRPCRHLQEPRRSEDGVQATGEPDSEARPADCLGWAPECGRVRSRAFCRVERYGFADEFDMEDRRHLATTRARPAGTFCANGASVGRVRIANGGRVQRAERHGRGRDGGQLRCLRRIRSRRRCVPSAASSAGWKSGPRSTASLSSTTSLTIRRPFAEL